MSFNNKYSKTLQSNTSFWDFLFAYVYSYFYNLLKPVNNSDSLCLKWALSRIVIQILAKWKEKLAAP